MTNKGIDITRNRMQYLIDCRGTIAVEGDDIVIRIPILNDAANRILDRLSIMKAGTMPAAKIIQKDEL